jgi:hypothetical protein
MYEGQWQDQMLHGLGYYQWSDGKYYKGEYFNDKKQGFGVYVLQDGRTYEGWWLEGKQHGLGKFVFKDGRLIIKYLSDVFIAKSGAMKTKKGLWEDGQRIMWLDDKE